MNIAALLIFPACMAFAAASDLLTMRISNWISIALVAGFLALAFGAGLSGQTILIHLACGALVLVGGFALFAFGWIGGGDAKLAAAIALWVGFGAVAEFLLIGSLLGAGLTLLVLQFRRWPLPERLRTESWLRLHDRKQGVPYGLALAIAALYIYPNTQFWDQIVRF